MQIQTSRFGLLELDDATVIQFPWGIPGFESAKHFVLLEHHEGPFQWLQAVNHPELAFVVCPPEIVGLRYRIPADKKAPIELERDEDLLLLIMVSFDRSRNSLKPHFKGPLLFNADTRKGYQWSMDSGELSKYISTNRD